MTDRIGPAIRQKGFCLFCETKKSEPQLVSLFLLLQCA